MFSNAPATDAIFMKWILHNWSDEDCVKLLRNCRKAITEKTGKIVIVDTILQLCGDGLFDNIGMALDLVMLTLFGGGKERLSLNRKRYKMNEDSCAATSSKFQLCSQLLRHIHNNWQLMCFEYNNKLGTITNVPTNIQIRQILSRPHTSSGTNMLYLLASLLVFLVLLSIENKCSNPN
ncbi:unnamed protein product [Camellia sinensis]